MRMSVRQLHRAQRCAQRVLICKNISYDQLCQISEKCSYSPNLIIQNRFKRFYPYKSLASHILGYLNKAENVGTGGLEKLFEARLSGETGMEQSIINATGKKLEKYRYVQAKPGDDIALTLDYGVQLLAEQMFEDDQSGALIVMDPTNGAIRAMVSYPNFDPNLFLDTITPEVWQEKFIKNKALLNRCTMALYPPASIFKFITYAAALEQNVITRDSLVECKGHITYCGRRYHCARRWGHGKLTLQDAIAYSCNVHIFNTALHLSIDTLADYAYRFGLGRKTNFILSEKSGLVPTASWKRTVLGERWWAGETLSASIGQSYLLVTPLQIARMVSAIATGYLVTPRLLVSQKCQQESLNVSESTLHTIRQAMNAVVQKGTFKRLKYLRDFQIYAKTGTAQTCSLSKVKTRREDYEHAWSVGFFSYKKQSPLVLVVLVEHTGVSLPAKRLVERFLRGYRVLQQAQAEQQMVSG